MKLEQYETQIKEIFTYEKLPAILAVLNSFRPPYGHWVRENEFETIVNAAKTEAMDDIQIQLQNFVASINDLPKVK